MPRLIDAIELRKELDKLPNSNPWNHDEVYRVDVEDIVELAPAVDAEPVIYCKDCIHSRRDKDGNIICEIFEDYSDIDPVMDPNDFCSWAIKKGRQGMKLIEVNKLLNAMYTDFSEHYSGRDSLSLFNLIKEEIEEQPIIDAEPVVRCKDCIHSYLDEDVLVCGQFRAFVEPDGFCSSGKCEVKE